MHHVAPELREISPNITEEDACHFLKELRKVLPCRNGSIVEFCPAISRMVRSNATVSMLGSGDYAKGAGMYMMKYFIKDAYTVFAALSVVHDAYHHIQEYPSRATDAGSSERTMKHFLQRLLCRGTCAYTGRCHCVRRIVQYAFPYLRLGIHLGSVTLV